jgi:outer membrane protein assembly factor BamB
VKYDHFSAVTPAADAGYLAVGTSYSFESATDASDAWLVWTDAQGHIVRDKVLGATDRYEQLFDVVWTGTHYVATGLVQISSSDLDTWLVYLDSTGQVVKSVTLPLAGTFEFGEAIALRPDNKTVVTLMQMNWRDGDRNVSGFGLMERSAKPSEVFAHWSKRYEVVGKYSTATSLELLADGRILLAGHEMPTNHTGPANPNAWVMLLDAQGGVQWRTAFVGGSTFTNDMKPSATKLSDGRIAVTANRDDCGQVFLLNAKGELQTQHSLCASSGFFDYRNSRITAEQDGGFTVYGATAACADGAELCEQPTNGSVLTLFDAAGKVVKHRFYEHTIDSLSRTPGMRRTPGGGYVIAGQEKGSTEDGFILVARSDGSMQTCAKHGVEIKLRTGEMTSFAISENVASSAGPNMSPTAGPSERVSATASSNACQ